MTKRKFCPTCGGEVKFEIIDGKCKACRLGVIPDMDLAPSTCCRHANLPKDWAWNKDLGRWEKVCPDCGGMMTATLGADAPAPKES